MTQGTASYITGEKGANRVRVFAHPRSGLLYLEYRVQGRKARTALGHRDWARAKAQADELAARLRRPTPERDLITLGELFDNYLREVTPTKGASKQAHDRRAARLLLEILGPARRVADLTQRDVARFVTERRRRGDLRTRAGAPAPVRARAVGYDLAFLRAALRWGMGAGWLSRNPLVGLVLPVEASPRRPIVTASEYEALVRVADQVHPLFRLALVLVHETGHRSGAVRLLRWADLDLERQLVRWRAENDKIGFEHQTYLTDEAVKALRAARRGAGVLSEWVFPGRDPREPASRYVFAEWWRRGVELAGLRPRPGLGWHSLRRQFATELKHVPLKDLAALGGWKSAGTILTCYQQADPVTMREALSRRVRLEA